GAGGPEKTVNLASVAPVGGRDDGEQVVLDLMALQKSQARQHAIEGRATALVVAMAIMELARTIQADAHEKALAVEKPSPVIGEQRPVRLDRVGHVSTGTEPSLQGTHLLEEIDAQERRLPTLPRELHFRRILACDVISHEGLQDVVRHPETRRPRIQRRLFEIKAVRAIEVAQRAGRFRQEMKRP